MVFSQGYDALRRDEYNTPRHECQEIRDIIDWTSLLNYTISTETDQSR
jgi:hypothetical protein